jgi:hypothetical protein
MNPKNNPRVIECVYTFKKDLKNRLIDAYQVICCEGLVDISEGLNDGNTKREIDCDLCSSFRGLSEEGRNN